MNKPEIHSDWLRAFTSVASSLSISAAGVELNLDKSQVSKRIALLENKLGTLLFARSTRKVALTPAGIAYLDHALRMLKELDLGEEKLRSLRVDLSGHIRITAPVSWGQRVLAHHLASFLKQHPSIEIEVILSDQKMDLARENIDLALRWTAKPSEGLSNLPISRIHWYLVASYAYLAAHGTPKLPKDLQGHECLCYWRESSDARWELQASDGAVENVQVQSRLQVNNSEAVLVSAVQGFGVAMLPDYLCHQAFAQQSLIRVLPDFTPLTKFGTHIHIQAASERMLLPRNRALLQHLQIALGANKTAA